MGTGILVIRHIFLFLGQVYHWIHAQFFLDTHLHRARFARTEELNQLLSTAPLPDGLLLGSKKARHFITVRPTQTRRELGNILCVAPTRGGKGLLATSQLLSWKHSGIVNDIKGELFNQ